MHKGKVWLRVMKRVMAILVLVGLLSFPVFTEAEELADKLAVGFQVTSQFTGFSFKYELDEDRIIQPIFYLSAQGDSAEESSRTTLAVRLLYDMGTNGSYQNYLGWGIGLKSSAETVSGVTTKDTSYGVQGFVGFERTSDSALSTSVEVSLGLTEEGDKLGGDYKAGLGLGLGVHYHF